MSESIRQLLSQPDEAIVVQIEPLNNLDGFGPKRLHIEPQQAAVVWWPDSSPQLLGGGYHKLGNWWEWYIGRLFQGHYLRLRTANFGLVVSVVHARGRMGEFVHTADGKRVNLSLAVTLAIDEPLRFYEFVKQNNGHVTTLDLQHALSQRTAGALAAYLPHSAAQLNTEPVDKALTTAVEAHLTTAVAELGLRLVKLHNLVAYPAPETSDLLNAVQTPPTLTEDLSPLRETAPPTLAESPPPLPSPSLPAQLRTLAETVAPSTPITPLHAARDLLRSLLAALISTDPPTTDPNLPPAPPEAGLLESWAKWFTPLRFLTTLGLAIVLIQFGWYNSSRENLIAGVSLVIIIAASFIAQERVYQQKIEQWLRAPRRPLSPDARQRTDQLLRQELALTLQNLEESLRQTRLQNPTLSAPLKQLEFRLHELARQATHPDYGSAAYLTTADLTPDQLLQMLTQDDDLREKLADISQQVHALSDIDSAHLLASINALENPLKCFDQQFRARATFMRLLRPPIQQFSP